MQTTNDPADMDYDLRALESGVRFGIGKRLILAFSFVAALSLLIVGVSWLGFSRLITTQSDITDKDVPAISNALSLSAQTNMLLATAPLLAAAKDTNERALHMSNLQVVLGSVQNHIDTLRPLIKDQAILEEIQNAFTQLPELLITLDRNTEQRLQYAARRLELSEQVTNFRNVADKALKPYISKVKFSYMGVSDQWVELIESLQENPEEAFRSLDTSELELAPLNIATFQNSLLEFQNQSNLLIGIILQASQSTDRTIVLSLQENFLQSIASMATPLSDINNYQDTPNEELTFLFQSLLEIGANGDLTDNVIKLRLAELDIMEESQQMLVKANEIASTLSTEVSFLVEDLKATMAQSKIENQESNKVLISSLIVVALFALISALAVGYFYIHRNLVTRLMRLVDNMKVIASGDLTTRVNRNGKDEISLMGSALAILRNGLRQTENLKEQQEEARLQAEADKKQHAQTLADNFDTAVGQSLTTLSNSLTSIRSKAVSMNEIAQVTMNETQDVHVSSQSMSQDIANVAASTEQLTKSINEISEQVTNSTSVAAEAVQRAETLSGNITQLQAGSNQIESVVALINSIAEQTNLLALNATIEASRAGDAGKGFAVVAGEVKNLANQTTNAIEDIASLINTIQSEIAEAVTANTQITSIISEIDQVSSGIAAAVEEQSAATGEISRTVQTASDSIQIITQKVEDVTSAIGNNNEMIDQVLGGVSDIDQQGKTLNQEVGTFLSTLRAE